MNDELVFTIFSLDISNIIYYFKKYLKNKRRELMYAAKESVVEVVVQVDNDQTLQKTLAEFEKKFGGDYFLAGRKTPFIPSHDSGPAPQSQKTGREEKTVTILPLREIRSEQKLREILSRNRLPELFSLTSEEIRWKLRTEHNIRRVLAGPLQKGVRVADAGAEMVYVVELEGLHLLTQQPLHQIEEEGAGIII